MTQTNQRETSHMTKTTNHNMTHKARSTWSSAAQNDHRMTSKYRESDQKAVGSYAFESLSRYFDVIRWSFCSALLQVECAYRLREHMARNMRARESHDRTWLWPKYKIKKTWKLDYKPKQAWQGDSYGGGDFLTWVGS